MKALVKNVKIWEECEMWVFSQLPSFEIYNLKFHRIVTCKCKVTLNICIFKFIIKVFYWRGNLSISKFHFIDFVLYIFAHYISDKKTVQIKWQIHFWEIITNYVTLSPMSPQLPYYCEYPYINTYFQKGLWQLPVTFPVCLHARENLAYFSQKHFLSRKYDNTLWQKNWEHEKLTTFFTTVGSPAADVFSNCQ